MSATPPRLRATAELPRLALRKEEAARACGLSDESFDRYVRPHVRVVRMGSMRLYPVAALEEWLQAQAEPPLEDR